MIFAKVFTVVMWVLVDAMVLPIFFLVEIDNDVLVVLAAIIATNVFMFFGFRYLANLKPCLIIEDDVVLFYKGKKLKHEISREGATFFEGPYKQMKVMPRQGGVVYLQLNFLDPSDYDLVVYMLVLKLPSRDYDLVVNMLALKQRQNETKEQHPFEIN